MTQYHALSSSLNQSSASLHGRSILICLFGLTLSALVLGCEPGPPCPEGTTLDGELPPVEDVQLELVKNKRFRGACVIPGSHGSLRHGFDKSWYRGGRVLKSHYTYEGGVRHGDYQLFSPDGKLRERGTYRFGLKHGRYARFHPNSNVHVEGVYEDGRRAGDFTITSNNGMHIQKGPYFLNRRHGMWTSTFIPLNGQKITQFFQYHEGNTVINP